jgi:hypothetical protein
LGQTHARNIKTISLGNFKWWSVVKIQIIVAFAGLHKNNNIQFDSFCPSLLHFFLKSEAAYQEMQMANNF